MALFQCKELYINSACTYSLIMEKGKKTATFPNTMTYGLLSWVRDSKKIIDALQDLGFDEMSIVNRSTIKVVDKNPTEIMRIIVASLISRFSYERVERRKHRVDYSTPRTFIETALPNKMVTSHMGSFGIGICQDFSNYIKDKEKLYEAFDEKNICHTWREVGYNLKALRQWDSNFYGYFKK